MTIEHEIEIKSDGNKLQFLSENKGIYTYKYIKSLTKEGDLLILSELELQKLIKTNS